MPIGFSGVPYLSGGELASTGLRELEAALNRLPEKVAKRIFVSAVRKGLAAIQTIARARAPERTGKLRRGIAITVKTYSSGAAGSNVAGKLGLVTRPKAASVYYGKFTELGTKAHLIVAKRTARLSNGVIVFGRSVEHPGQPPTKWFSDSFRAGTQAAVDVFRLELAAGIDLAVAEARRG